MKIFIAIQLDKQTKSILNHMTKSLMSYFSKARYTNKENYHITLKFIGEVERVEFNKIVKVVKTTASKVDRFILWTKGVGSFQKKNKHIFYCSIKEATELNNLYLVLNKELKNNGLKLNDGKFTPHITLGREVVLVNEYPEIEFEKSKIEVKAISVMESTRVNGKLTYIPKFTAKLKGS